MFPQVILGTPTDDTPLEPLKKSKKKKSKGKGIHPHYHTDAVVALSWNTQARSLLASGSADQTIKLWDLNSPAKALRSFHAHKDKVAALQWNPASPTVLLSGGFDATVSVFDTRSPDQSSTFKLKSDVECLAWDPFAPERFMVSSEDGLVTCYDARNTKGSIFKVHAHDGPVSALDLSPVIKGCMITGSADKTVKVWNLEGNAPACVVSRDLGTVWSL